MKIIELLQLKPNAIRSHFSLSYRNAFNHLYRKYDLSQNNTPTHHYPSMASRRIGNNYFTDLNIDWCVALEKTSLFSASNLLGHGVCTRINIEDEDKLTTKGWRSIVEEAHDQQSKGISPNAAIGLFVNVETTSRNRGMAQKIVSQMRKVAKSVSFSNVYIPLMLPSSFAKSNCSKSITEYGVLKREDGEYADYWLRLHTRLGATVLGTQENSHVYGFTADEIKRYTSLYPEKFILENDMVTIEINGLYYCGRLNTRYQTYLVQVPCVWVSH
ncbi:hypothetical protein BVY03_02700, partial [bacterium K02(2017)]